MPDASLKALLGERVTVTNPAHGSAWTGKLIGLHDDPGVVIEQDGGFRLCLPQSFTVTAAPEVPAADARCSWQAVFGADDLIDCALPAGHEGAHDYSLPVPPGHACTYPPDGHLGTGRCMTCGQPAPDPIIAYLRDAAEHFIRPRLPLMAAELEDFTGRLAAALSTAEVAS